MLVNPTFADAETHARDVKEAALPLGLQIHVVRARTVDDFDTAFAALAQQKIDALLLANDSFFHGERRKLIALAARYAIPAVYFWRDFPVDGRPQTRNQNDSGLPQGPAGASGAS